MSRPPSGGWKGSTRRSRLPADWARLRVLVLARDHGRCTESTSTGSRCGAAATDVDHITRGDDHSLSNLRALCRACHLKKSSREGVEAKPHRARAPEEHPSKRRH